MAKVIDLTESDGDLVILGRSLVLPSSELDSQPSPLNGALRFNPAIGKAQLFSLGAWVTLGEGTGGGSGDGSKITIHTRLPKSSVYKPHWHQKPLWSTTMLSLM